MPGPAVPRMPSESSTSSRTSPGVFYVAPPVFTAIYSPLGDLASWREKMREALEQRTSELVFLQVYPWLDNLRSDPVYLEIVAKIGLP